MISRLDAAKQLPVTQFTPVITHFPIYRETYALTVFLTKHIRAWFFKETVFNNTKMLYRQQKKSFHHWFNLTDNQFAKFYALFDPNNCTLDIITLEQSRTVHETFTKKIICLAVKLKGKKILADNILCCANRHTACWQVRIILNGSEQR